MDASKVWQWRIMRVKTYLRRPNPFYHSNSIGLDFNVASNTQKKLDIQLVTNGVILEICDFARKVNKSRRHFITEILENNFDLASENEQQRIDFNARIVHKVNDLIKKPPKDKNEVFTLFDTSCTPECNNGLNMASTKRKTKGFLVEMDDTDDSENEDTFQCSQATSKEHIKTESPLVEIEEVHVVDRQHEDELKGSETQSAEARREAVLPLLFPCCEEIGLSLDVGSKQSLDPGLLTKGVMLELVHFTRILTASYSPIVLGVLEHNFELDVSSRQAKSRVWFKISHLLKRRKRFLTTGSKMTPEFKNERFSFQTNPFKRTTGSPLSNVEGPQYQLKEVTKRRQSDLKSKQEKTALSTTGERGNKRCRREQSKEMETNTLSPNTMYTGQITKEDHCYTCPLGESDLDSDTGNKCDMEQEEMRAEINYTCPLGESDLDSDAGNKCDMEQEEMRAEINYTCPLGESDLDSDTGNTCDMEQEEMGTENNMWKLRANCVKQILSSLNKELGPSKEFCIEFNVGFGPKQNISIDSLPNYLLEVAKFALAMNSSRQDFITEILEYNFDICLQSKWQKNIFTSEILNRVRKLRRCEGAVKISKEVSELPGPMPSINMMNHTVDSVKHELSRILRMEGCDVAPVCPPHSHAETTEHISAKSVDHYPFCEEIGLKLHVNKHQQNKKLDIDKLTNGAMNEVTNFAEKLCGTFEQICLDILGHNFNLDLKSGDSDLARSIVGQIYAVLVQQNLATCASKGVKITGKEFSTMIKLDCQNNPNSDICDVGSSQAAIIDQDVGSSADTKHQNELNLKLWRFRANRIEQILSVPHKEHCPLYSYTRCKKLGINFNVGSGEKQKLDPKSLTNGIMVELNTFATALSCQKHVITEILDYNFHLDFGNEVYRSAFAQQIRDKVEASHANKKYSIPRMKMLLNLLDMTCIQERKTHCLKCYQDRSHKLCQEEADPGHMHHLRPHTMADTVSADSNCTAPKPAKHPSSNFSGAEKTIMHSYPRCKKIGLNLCMDKDQPKDKLDTHVLTHRIMNEVASFAEILCGTKNKIINDIIEHNFNICMQGRELNPSLSFQKVAAQSDCSPAWLSEVYVIQRYSHKQPGYLGTVKREAAMQRSEGVETIKKRKLALQTKKERATLSRHKISVVKSKKNPQSKGNCLPICTDIGLDLDMTSKTGEKEKLDLKLLTRAVCDMEQEEMGTVNYYTCPPDSDKFSNSGDTGIQDNFQNTKSCSLSSVIPRESESTCLDIRAPFLTTNDISPSLPNVNPPLENQPGERVLCGGEEQTQTPSNALNECEMEEEEMGTEDMWKVARYSFKTNPLCKRVGSIQQVQVVWP
ncbi:uncharacterized protein LOC115028824 isoform X1 [Cottoperca gobio]|uniref:Uncharacterized protein LOC115028824 isoform X1 n=1 Tax=Cottoperca gobio TaxID=56716 RepID=A0A6J2S5K2_COTGO|nr:uncharacterized protein LOC115028824 isoform X1 [Cottoperca gobio]XP_029318544.1 uncharacterized protein LOC115028824 isoform X1 [Cottoperca gobio]XP_029318545.1 uncharacterized protein LOC115028824 isoform X1 [Cottoperca gobio]